MIRMSNQRMNNKIKKMINKNLTKKSNQKNRIIKMMMIFRTYKEKEENSLSNNKKKID